MAHPLATSSSERIRGAVQELLQTLPDIKAAAVVRISGLAVETIMPAYVDEERVSAMISMMLLLGERMTEALQTGQMDKVYIHGSAGHIVLMAIDQQAVLTVMASEQMPVGQLFLELGQAVRKLRTFV